MRTVEWAAIIGWFLLALYVMYRCFASNDVDFDILFAAWCGGVLSTVCYSIFRSRNE